MSRRKLFLEVKENFARLIEEYRKKHWFKEFFYQFTGGEDLIDMDRIGAMLWYWKLILALKALRVLLKIAPPSEEQVEEMIMALEGLKERLEVD